jgi:hypothetical protein
MRSLQSEEARHSCNIMESTTLNATAVWMQRLQQDGTSVMTTRL